MTTVVVVEPHELLRLGILQHLTDVLPESLIQAVDYSPLFGQTFANGESDLVLLSVALSENPVALAQAAQRAYAPKWMLLLSDLTTMPDTWQDLPSIVAGYVPRSASPDVLAASIRLVLAGGKCFQSMPSALDPVAHTPGLHAVASTPKTIRSLSSSLANMEAQMLRITPRQYEVLVLLARGYPIKTVSRHLNISVATAKAHTETLYQRLGAHNRNQAVYTAVSCGATLGWKRLGSNITKESLHRR
jgi:two-component system, NarL family, nitrate/nitrite response regulator NarL